MRELIACWQHTRMIVLIALTAALYVSVLIPFKIAVVVPGITEIRPAAALPIVFSIFFGPAAAWGAAFGNTIADFFGTIGPGSLFGFVGNFIYGFVPYRIVRTFMKPGESLFSRKGWVVLLYSFVLAGGLCATIIALGVSYLLKLPFELLVHTIFLNNFLMSLILAPLLIRTLDKRILQMQLGYHQILEAEKVSAPLLKGGGSFLVLFLLLAIYAILMIPSVMQAVPFAAGNPEMFKLCGSILLPVAALLFL